VDDGGVSAAGDGCVGPDGILSVIMANCMGIFVMMSAGLRTERVKLCFPAPTPALCPREREFWLIQVGSCFLVRLVGFIKNPTGLEMD
jgi:hypothetical protein